MRWTEDPLDIVFPKEDPTEEDKYEPGTKVQSCDIEGVICHPHAACEPNELIVRWETEQTYTYTREWLDDNVKVIR